MASVYLWQFGTKIVLLILSNASKGHFVFELPYGPLFRRSLLNAVPIIAGLNNATPRNKTIENNSIFKLDTS